MNRPNLPTVIGLWLGLALLSGCAGLHSPGRAGAAAFEEQDVFVAGVGGYHTYRIPSLIVTQKGTVLAFCEGRKNSAADTGDIDLLLKRSTDGGRSWGPVQVIADHGPDTVGNPCPVVDRSTGTIWLLLTGNKGDDSERAIAARTARSTRTVWVARSDDDGKTWTEPVDITASVKPKEWTWYATGPGCGIQLHSGRMVIPCDHNLAGRGQRREAHVIYSDDHGRSWKVGGVVKNDVNECQVVELADGALMLNMRSYAKGEGKTNRRAVAISKDGGLTWSEPTYPPELVEPVCQAAIVRLTEPFEQSRGCLVFSNPASTKRENMTVRASFDDGKSWPVARTVYAGPAAYSALAGLADGKIGLLYERGEKGAYEKITLARFSLEWVMPGGR